MLVHDSAAKTQPTSDMTCIAKENGFVRVVSFGELRSKPSWTYVIAHGLGGTKAGDRFHVLSNAIQSSFPEANVLLVEWNEVAKKKNLFGLPAVWRVSSKIRECGIRASELLKELNVDPKRTTVIGESFGTYVNFEIARQLGGIQRMLCFNPASELGGYRVPQMTNAVANCYSFHTVSMYDTQASICDHDIRLKLPHGMLKLHGHSYGIRWLTNTLRRDNSWLLCERELPHATEESFAGTVSPNGHFDPDPVPRKIEKDVCNKTHSLETIFSSTAIASV